MFSFRCVSCDEEHKGMPTFGWRYPIQYLDVPESERQSRCVSTSDTCVIDKKFFFVRGCIEIPVVDEEEPFAWGTWASLSEKHFLHFQELFGVPKRSHFGPFVGWLSSYIWLYPDTINLKTHVHLRDDGIGPYIELEPADHRKGPVNHVLS